VKIISKTPLRLPFAGGLTDLRPYSEKFGGVTVSICINKYIRVYVERHSGKGFHLTYLSKIEQVDYVESVKHEIIRECLKKVGLENEPLRLQIISDLPGESGLGSSGALGVGVLNALYGYTGKLVSQQRLAHEAAEIEIDVLRGSCGDHDPSITAMGGLKEIIYDGATVDFNQIKLSRDGWYYLQDRLLLFYSGKRAKTNDSLHKLEDNMILAAPILHMIKKTGYEIAEVLKQEAFRGFGRLFQRQQDLKLKLPGDFFDEKAISLIEKLRSMGCYSQIPGGKVGGFIIVFFDDLERRKEILSYMEEQELVHIPFLFEKEGSSVMKQD